MTVTVEVEQRALISRLDEAVAASDPARIVLRVKAALESLLRADELHLLPRLRRTTAGSYARRLLHRDPAGRYTVVVMTWGPGQGTALHDHSGLWCVECVVEGAITVTQYGLTSENAGAYAFAPEGQVTASRGEAGCLIPPFEYHTLANACADRPSVTLHVYGGEMSQCHVFEPAGAGTYHRVTRDLSYDA